MSRFPSRVLVGLAWLILVLGMARAAALVLGNPVAGYANQFDMLRTSACLGFWPQTAEGIPREQATPAAPISHYTHGERDAFNCLPGSEMVVSGLAVALASVLSGDSVDLRWLGGFKLLLLCLAGFALQRAFSQHAGASLLHAVIFAGVLCDPFNLLYANSLYTEFTALLGLYLALASLMAACWRERFNDQLAVMWFAGLLLLGGSRVQHLLLPLALLLPAWYVLRVRSGWAWMASLVLALGIGGAQVGLQKNSEAISDANVVNTLFYSVLPAAAEPRELAEDLGLDAACADLAHTSWYLTRGQDHRSTCPQAFELSRGRMLATLLSQPTTLTTLVFRALYQSGAWRLSYVGEVADASFERVAGWRGFSLAGGVAALSFGLYAALYGLALWPGIWAGSRLLRFGSLLTPARLALGVGFTSLALVMVIVFGTSLMGDGFSEFSRHAHLAHNAAIITWIITPVALVRLARHYGPQALVVPFIGYVLLATLVVWLARTVPVTAGVLETPNAVYIEPGRTELAGWAGNPWGVAEVRVELRNEARSGSEAVSTLLDTRPSAEVSAYLPVGERPVRFSGVIDAREGMAGDELRIIVVDKRGKEAVVERRHLR